MATPTQARSELARAVREKDPEREYYARQVLAEANIERAIRKAIDTAPPLTIGQRERLVALLMAGGNR